MSPTTRRLSALLRSTGCRSATSGLWTTAEDILSAASMARSRVLSILARISYIDCEAALPCDTPPWFPNRHPTDNRQRSPRIADLQQPLVADPAALVELPGPVEIHRQLARPDHREESDRSG